MADYVKALGKVMENCIGKYEDFLQLLAAGIESPVIGNDGAFAGEQGRRKRSWSGGKCGY